MFYLTYTHYNVINLKSVVNYYPHLVTTSGRYCFCPDRCGFVYLLFCLSSEIIICSGTCHKRSDLFQVKNKMFLDGSSVAPPCFLTLKGQRFRSDMKMSKAFLGVALPLVVQFASGTGQSVPNQSLYCPATFWLRWHQRTTARMQRCRNRFSTITLPLWSDLLQVQIAVF